MIAAEDRLASALESAVEDLEFSLDAASLEFEVMASPNTNQYIIADGDECWVLGDMTVAEAATYIING